VGHQDGAATTATFAEPSGLAVSANELYVADTNNHVVRVVSLDTGDVRMLHLRGLSPPISP
jgi:hypothetical protein